MAGEGEGFWLPSEFLTDDDFLMDKENFKTESASEFRFPTEFPYGFETRNDQFLEKLMMMASSPLAHHLRSAGGSSNGSPNGFLSPPTTPSGAKYDAVGDLIYLAAGEVAKLRLNRGYAEKALSVPPRTHAQFYSEAKMPTPSVYLNSHNEGSGMLYNRQQMGQVAWNPTRGSPVLYGGRAAAKKTCAGTGVFLPRRYENITNKTAHSSDSQRKTGRAPIQVQTNNFANVNASTQSDQPHHNARINRAFVPDYRADALMARRQLLALQQRRSLLASLAEGTAMMGREMYLPEGNSDISGLW